MSSRRSPRFYQILRRHSREFSFQVTEQRLSRLKQDGIATHRNEPALQKRQPTELYEFGE